MKRTNKNYRKLVIYIMVFGLVTAMGYSLLRMPSTPPQVAQIAVDERMANNCVSNLSSFAASGACGAQGFNTYSYSCLSGPEKPLEKPNTHAGVSCIDFTQAFAKASILCGETCKPAPTPTLTPRPPAPSPRLPTPPPTADPSPLVSCVTETYRLPANLKVESVTKETLANYLVDPNQVVFAPGEKIAFNILLTNIKPYPLAGGMLDLQAWTSVLNLPQEPFKILGQSPLCNVQGDGKTISCLQPQFELGTGQSAYPNMFFVAEVLPGLSNEINIMYRGIHSKSPFVCAAVKAKVDPTPIHPPRQKCYKLGLFKWCRRVNN